ncbi:MAG: hypothetical protein QM786_03175 [Breznakibacter sp.]
MAVPVYENAHQVLMQAILEISPDAACKFGEVKHKYPNHPATLYLENYQAFVDLLARERSVDMAIFTSNTIARIGKIDAMSSPNASVYKCNMYLHVVMSEALKGNNFTAVKYLWKAYREFGAIPSSSFCVQERRKLNALFSIMAASVPDQYQWAVGLLASHKGLVNAMKDLDCYVESQKLQTGLGDEAVLIKALVDLKLSENASDRMPDVARTDYSHKPLLAYIDGLMILKLKMSSNCIAGVSDDVCERFPPLHYIKGRMMWNNLDGGAAGEFATYLDAFKGESFKTDVRLRLAWIHLLGGKRALAYQMADDVVENPSPTPTYADRQALSELKSIRQVVPLLLKARLLYDGGNAQKTLSLLINNPSLAISHPFEYNYRIARAYHDLQDYQKALVHYRLVLSCNADPKSYFAPFSALMAAKIEFESGEKSKGREMVLLCQSLNKGEYKADIDQEAGKLLKQYCP